MRPGRLGRRQERPDPPSVPTTPRARAAWLGVVGASLLAAGCATTPPAPHGAPYRPVPPRAAQAPPPAFHPNPPPQPDLTLSDLPGWADEDHAAALAAFAQGCGVSREVPMREVCADARRMGAVDDPAARRFFETHFRVAPLAGEGVLTAYFAPEYEARRSREPPFTAPVRPRPAADVTILAAGPPTAPTSPDDGVGSAAADPDDPVAALLANGTPAAPIPYRALPQQPLATADRSSIEASPAPDALAWMRPEDLFFLQIQGSGVLDFPDGRRAKAVYAGDNRRPFTAIARPMVQAGLLAANRASGDNIRAWLAAHAGPEAEAVMRRNARYVFFAIGPDDGREPAGAAGVPLPPGRALAVDPSRHGYGELYWVDAEAPVLSGAAKRYRRLALSLDTGSAIRGEVRADLYTGRGAAAGQEAGRVRHTLRLVRLLPVEPS